MLRFRCKLVLLILADSKKQEPFKKNADKIYDITPGNFISPRSSLLPDRGKETGPASVADSSKMPAESAEQETLGSAVESLLDKKSEETDHRSLRSVDSSEDKTAISSDIAGTAAKPEDQLPPGETAAAAAVEQGPAETETLRSSTRQSDEFESSSVLKVSDSETPQSRSAATEPTIEAKRMFRKQ